MKRSTLTKFLFTAVILSLFQTYAIAQVGLIIQLPENANIDVVAAHMGGVKKDWIPGTTQFLLNVPAAPHNLPDNEVRWMELNKKTTLHSASRAKYLNAPTGMPVDWYKTQPALSLIHSPGALAYSTGMSIVVADINSNVDYSHPALLGHLTSGYDFVTDRPLDCNCTLNDESSASYLDDESSASYLDQASVTFLNESSASYLDESSASYLDGLNLAYSHGTLTAGMIAAVAPNAMIMPIRTFDENGASDLFLIAKAIRYAANNGAKVINLSFGTLIDSNAVRSAIQYAQNKGVVITASAGNSNTSVPQYPAAYSGVFTVAATNNQDVKASFSNYGSVIDIDAPGVNVISVFPGNLYGIVSGTSFSAPILAGTAALLLAQPITTPVQSRLHAGAINIDSQNPGYAGQLGNGRIDVLQAVQSQ